MRTRDEWVAVAAGRDACLAPVLTIDEAPEHPQMRARDVYANFDGFRHPSPAPPRPTSLETQRLSTDLRHAVSARSHPCALKCAA
ncbi:hypothetical protein [Bradyrhizobium erythrophlei]|uniref:hypothetical protein n=1 Tax=Bradyrhizobium erythrophlei TaxID=1437360 RepID=UPI0012AB636D